MAFKNGALKPPGIRPKKKAKKIKKKIIAAKIYKRHQAYTFDIRSGISINSAHQFPSSRHSKCDKLRNML